MGKNVADFLANPTDKFSVPGGELHGTEGKSKEHGRRN